jgi:hypothetical protein
VAHRGSTGGGRGKKEVEIRRGQYYSELEESSEDSCSESSDSDTPDEGNEKDITTATAMSDTVADACDENTPLV